MAPYWIGVCALRLVWQVNPSRAFESMRDCDCKVARTIVKSLPRKTSKLNQYASVPQTDTGDQVEKTKANE